MPRSSRIVDQDVKALGNLVSGQTDIREISGDTAPLWFDGLDPAKINFGLAMYGRGYTLAKPSVTSCCVRSPDQASLNLARLGFKYPLPESTVD